MRAHAPALLFALLPTLLAGPRPATADEVPTLVLRGLDPIALVAGREVLGSPDLVASFLGEQYRFATAENRATFLADPEAHAIQLGGACARMGPLSGRGDSALYHVEGGRIYVFASEQCRTTFSKEPARFLATDDPRPAVAPATAARGRELAERALAAAGGRAAVLAAAGWSATTERQETHGETTYNVGTTVVVDAESGAVSRKSWYGDWWETHVDAGSGAFVVSDDGVRDLAASQRRELARIVARQPLALLRAVAADDAVLEATGPGSIAGREVERVVLWQGGLTTTLGLDPTSGALVGTSYRGRTRGGLAAVEQLWSEAKPVGGCTLPTTVATSADGVPVEHPEAISLTVLDPDDATFRRPSG